MEEAVEGIIILYLLMTNKECIDDIALKEFGEQCPLSKLQELVMDREAWNGDWTDWLTSDCNVKARHYWISSVQSVSHVQLFVTPWTAARQASLSITNSRSLLRFMSIVSVLLLDGNTTGYHFLKVDFKFRGKVSILEGTVIHEDGW